MTFRASAFLLMTSFLMTAAAFAETKRDLEYGRAEGVSLRMDASIPEGNGPFPAVIIVHGGGWVAGDRRTNVQPLFEPLSDAGFAWFSVSYRLASNITQFGLGISDVQTAIRYIKAHAAEFRIDPARIALIGESAGGQLAAMAMLTGGAETNVKAMVALYTPTDLVDLAKNSNYVPQNFRDSVRGTPWEKLMMVGLEKLSPLNNVRAGMPPMLFIHGTADALVPFAQSREMCDRMKAVGASCEIFPVEGGGHGVRWWESIRPLATPYKKKMVDWLRQQLAAPVRSANLN